ncbi:hypothetical protein F5887DRAFT_1207359 [Amanita rubescens]|nr:hypothetical protein F5887DRAFT_1207359 [Amanita rubescens]
MISFSVTPFTDLPAHRIIRSYFTKERHNEEQPTVDSELSHLWSEERRYEENRFAMIMTELNAMAKELGVVVSGTPDLESIATAESSTDCSTLSTTPEAESRYLALPDGLFVAPSEAYAYMDSDTWYLLEKAREEQRQERWLNRMDIKVQTLLQEARDVLGTPTVPSSTSESLQGLCSDIANEDDASYNVPFDVISLYMRDESSSFTSDGSTLLEGNTSFDHDSIITGSNSDGDWLVGDTSTDTSDTSFSSDQYVATDKPSQSQECIYEPKKQLDPVLERSTIQCHSIQWSPFTNEVLLP